MASRKRPVSETAAQPALPAEDPAADGSTADHARFPVVGIGASAGGLEAFKKLFGALPADSGLAFVLIPHLDPTHESLMVSLLSKTTAIPVVEAEEGMAVEPNHVYIIPPNKYMSLRAGTLHLTGPVDRRGSQTAIDLFLRALAEDQQEKAICIILSGTGAHGSLGLREIKANGGMVMVQDPDSAAYAQMPQNAVATGLADYVLPPEQMPAALLRFVRAFYREGGFWADGADGALSQLNPILTLLRSRSRCDFRCYRKNMILRRVERRMSLNHLSEIPAYLSYLRENPDEIKRLIRDLLISVTRFFRDVESFHALALEVIAPLVERHADAETPVRVWVPGCATGEEAYSIAILLLEQLALSQKKFRIQIFASDLDDESLQAARLGQYPASIAADVSPARLEQFFTRVDENTYQVNKTVRETINFASQDLIGDAPFSKLDLISCRNLLIYLEPEVQKKIIPLLHFALNEGGYLFLGPSETIGRQHDLFEPVSKKWRIFRRIGPTRPERVDFPIAPSRQPRAAATGGADLPSGRLPSVANLAQQVLLDAFAPAALLINRNGEVLYYHGATGNYLEMPTGEPTHDLLRMARSGLRTKLRSAIHQAIHDHHEATIPRVRFKRDGSVGSVKLTVKPVQSPRYPEGLLLVVFEEQPDPQPPAPADEAVVEGALAQQMEADLRAVREDLQHTIEELEGSNEEMKSSNEEMMSMNEELQSANEELETSKEELQSLNEELSTVNSQLHDKVAELETTNNDLANLLSCTDIATIFLDTHFHIKKFTPATADLLNLIATDLGRPIADIAWKFTDDTLLDEARQVLRNLTPREREVRTQAGQWYLRRLMPYRTTENHIEGLVITFVDITQIKRAEEQQRLLAAVLRDSNDAVSIHDFSGHIRAWNRGAERMYGYTEAEALTLSTAQLVPPELRAETAALFERLRCGEPIDGLETRRVCKGGQVLDVWVTLTTLKDEAGRTSAVATTERDITERKRADERNRELNASLEKRVAERTAELAAANHIMEQEAAERQRAEESLRESNVRLVAILNHAADGIIIIDGHGIVSSFNKAAEKQFGYTSAEIVGGKLTRLMPYPYCDEFDDYLANYLRTGVKKAIGRGNEVVGLRKDGTTFPIDVSVSEVNDQGRRFFSGILRDMSERRSLEREMLEVAEANQRQIGQDLHDSVGQELTGLGLMADSLVEMFSDRSQPAAQAALKIVAGVRAALKQVRALSFGLVPVEVDAEGLMAALDDLATRTGTLSNRNCTFTCAEPVLVKDKTTASHLYHIAQEAVANALKHGQAEHIDISLQADDRRLRLTIRDDGVGIKAKPSSVSGMGLKIMQYRAGLINATLEVDSDEHGGTRISCVQIRGDSHADENDDA